MSNIQTGFERMPHDLSHLCFFFFNDTATTEIYTLSLHDALPIRARFATASAKISMAMTPSWPFAPDRKSTRLNSSHVKISYAVFCLKKTKNNDRPAARQSQTRPLVPPKCMCTTL